MQWEFSAEQVVKGEVGYGLAEFRLDLAREVEINLPDAGECERAATYDLLYDLCHWRATGRQLDAFVASFAHDPPTCEFLRSVAPALEPNAEMLGAILQRMIMDRVESGLPLDAALDEVAAEQRRVAAESPVRAPTARTLNA
jgi:hypothetical protein